MSELIKSKGKLSGKALLLALLGQAVFLILTTAPTAMAAGAREYETPPCYDVTGSTQSVLVSGVNNGGIMDFDDAGVSAAHQACVRMQADRITPNRLEGWVWNSNLGWVSLYCPGGVGALNLDVACGTQAYSVTFTPSGGTAPNFGTVTMAGYAWGDNIGWVSFRDVVSGSTWNWMRPTPSGGTRGQVPAAPNADRYGWADSVGWLDFRTVWFHWEDTDPPLTDPDVLKYVSVCSSNDPLPPGTITDPKCTCDLDGTCAVHTDPAKIPYANLTDKYDIKIPFVYGGVAIPNGSIEECSGTSINMYTMAPGVKPYCAKIALTWEDDVDFDQTTVANQTQATPKFNATNTGAALKPLTFGLFGASDFTYDGVNTLWGAMVRSYAPTSERSTMDGMQNEKFYYSDISSGYDVTKTSQNLLKLKEMRLLFFKYSTGVGLPGECIYGTIGLTTCDMRNYMTAAGTTLSFNPLAVVGTLSNTVGTKNLNFISIASPDNPVVLRYQGLAFPGINAGSGKIEGYAGLQSSANYRLKLVSSFPTDPASEPSPGNYFLNAGPGGPLSNLTGQLFSDSPGATIDANAGPYVYTVASYQVGIAPANRLIKYFGGKLPRIKAGLLLNPVAKVEGNVYVTDFAKKAADVTLNSLGNISSNLRREAVVRNVAKYLNGFTGTIVTANKTVATGTTASINNLTTLVSDANRKVFYLLNGDLTLDCGATCAFDSNTTFIVENGNIYVNSNIVPTGNNQVGLIALRNLSTNAQNQGLLYIDKAVTWLSGVQIYLDRVVQSYDKTVAVSRDTNGFVKYAGDDDYARQARFNSQLVFEGTISGMNGIGNASRVPATDENGSTLGAGTYCSNYGPVSNLAGICRARLVDLNYQRYYGPGLEICVGTEGTGAVSGVPRDQALKASTGNGCDPTDVAYDIVATDLYSTGTPTFDLISGASGGARSQYFITKGLPAIISNEFPVNFFYKPIAKNLAGFEVDSNINPLLQN